MTPKAIILAALLSLTLPLGAAAGDKGHKGHDQSGHQGCPPGLAKKNPPCIPPGQAKKMVPAPLPEYDWDQRYAVGHDLPDDYVVVFDPALYPFWQQSLFVRYGDFLYLIDRVTGRVLDVPGPVDGWNWRWQDVDFGHCPPGLAKKNPPCIPPGQAKAMGPGLPYNIGDTLPPAYVPIITPRNGPDDTLYVRRGDELYGIDRQTRAVMQILGGVSDLLR